MRRAYPSLAALGLLLASVGTPLAHAQADIDLVLAEPQEQGGLPTRAIARLSNSTFVTVNGSALLERTASGLTAVTIDLYGLEPGTQHTVDLRGGSCTGPVLMVLQDMIVDGRGIGTTYTTVPAPINPENWWINVHGWDTLASPSISCGPVSALAPGRPGRPPGGPRPDGRPPGGPPPVGPAPAPPRP
jgi:hypothetical protein